MAAKILPVESQCKFHPAKCPLGLDSFKTEDEANDSLEESLEEHEDADVDVKQPLINRM